MSGWAWSRLFMAVGWVGLVAGLAVYTVPVAIVVGSILLITYGAVAVDIEKPSRKAREEAEKRRKERNNGVYITTPRR